MRKARQMPNLSVSSFTFLYLTGNNHSKWTNKAQQPVDDFATVFCSRGKQDCSEFATVKLKIPISRNAFAREPYAEAKFLLISNITKKIITNVVMEKEKMYALSRTLGIRLSAALAAAVLMLMSAPASAQLTEVMFCGSTQRTGVDLYGAAGPYTEVTGCAPTSNTRAMLVTRYGTVSGNGPAWLAYLNGGGKIITEYSIAHTVYNAIYGTAYLDGDFFGNCNDNAMPQVKLNPTHPFWTVNNITVTPSGQGACGRSLSALVAGESGVTGLGGDQDGSVMFAIRPQGAAGMLYLLEADWQDNQSNYTDDSRTFMAALIGSQWVNATPMEAKPIPTLSQWGTMLLAGMLSLFALMRLHRKG